MAGNNPKDEQLNNEETQESFNEALTVRQSHNDVAEREASEELTKQLDEEMVEQQLAASWQDHGLDVRLRYPIREQRMHIFLKQQDIVVSFFTDHLQGQARGEPLDPGKIICQGG